MAVWFCAPTKRPLAESTITKWIERGYRVATLREPTDEPVPAHLVLPVGQYLGWARSTNILISHVILHDREAEWFVAGGDDYLPDPHHTPESIALETADFFRSVAHRFTPCGTFGVMQPTGDDWRDSQGRIIERIAGSPWIGKEFVKRTYNNGHGPLFDGYFHNFADEELQCVAQQLGVFWQRPDLTQRHNHFARNKPDWQETAPEWWKRNCGADFTEAKKLFDQRKAQGFPGAMP